MFALYLIMLSLLLSLPPHLHPWCCVCRWAVLYVWTPVWSFLKFKTMFAFKPHTHTQPFHMCSHSPLSYTANHLSRRVISTVIQSGFGPRVIGYQSLAVKSIKITPTGDLQVLATLLMWTIHLINQYDDQKVLQFNTLLFYSSLKAWDYTHFIRTKPHSQWAVYPLR